MSITTNAGASIHWELEGRDKQPPLVLLNSVGTGMSMWDAALPFLRSNFRLLRIDSRGHGGSDAPQGDYSLALLASDVSAVMDAVGIARAAVAGVSLGGMIAMELALEQPDRVSELALICSSATMDRAAWADRVERVRSGGTAAIADLAMSRFFSPDFIARRPKVAMRIRDDLINMADAGYAGAAAAIRDMALIDRLPALRQPTLVVVGDRDTSTPFIGHGERLAATIPRAEVIHIAAGHLAPLEAPAELADALRRFLLLREEPHPAPAAGK